jgi:Protein of unknown function (DUF993)
MNKPVRSLATSIRLPKPDRSIELYHPGEPRAFPRRAGRSFNRIAFAAAHVVADPLSPGDPWLDAALDWEKTLAYREYLFDLGLGVAEAMDTAQRGMGLGWPVSLELIGRTVEAARRRKDALVFCGAGTDHLAPDEVKSLDDVIRAYEEQIAAIEAVSGRIILMASRALARIAKSAEDYASVYGHVLRQVREPVIIHWLGDMFDPALAGYWGSDDLDEATETALEIINADARKVDGIKISLLDKNREIAMRPRLAEGVRMYTGDDFAYAELIEGDGRFHSDALLGIFDAVAPAASAALGHLAAGDRAAFNEILAPTVPLSRHIFEAPTRFYKTGVVFMAYLNGHQDHFTLVGGQESARSTLHLAELFRLADRAGLLRDPARSASRMQAFLATRGVEP